MVNNVRDLFNQFLRGDLDNETRRQICDTLENDPHGELARMIREHEELARNTFNIDWGELANSLVALDSKIDKLTEKAIGSGQVTLLSNRRPWIELRFPWRDVSTHTADEIAAMLIGVFCQEGDVFLSGLARGELSEQQQEREILASLADDGSVLLHGIGRYVTIGVKNGVVELKIGESASRTYSAFRVEFCRRGSVISSVDAQNGVALLPCELWQAAIENGADLVIIDHSTMS